jgi:hypothetical protein
VCFSFGLPPLNLEIVIVPVFLLESLVDVRIYTCDASSWHCRVLLLSQSGSEGEESDKKERKRSASGEWLSREKERERQRERGKRKREERVAGDGEGVSGRRTNEKKKNECSVEGDSQQKRRGFSLFKESP